METKCTECNGDGAVEVLYLSDSFTRTVDCPKCEGYGTLLAHMNDGSEEE